MSDSTSSNAGKFSTVPAIDTAILQQMAYKSSYTESINKQMQVPDTIVVAEQNGDYSSDHKFKSTDYSKTPAFTMEVPDRIVVSVGESGAEYGKGTRDIAQEMHFTEVNSPQPLQLQTPPRVLTLQDRNLDSLDINVSNAKSEEECKDTSSSRLRPADLNLNSDAINRNLHITGNSVSTDSSPKGIFENLHFESKKFYREVLAKLNLLSRKNSNSELMNWRKQSEVGNQSFSEDLDDLTVLRNEMLRLHKRVEILEQRQENKSTFDYCFYGFTVGLWLLNAWFLYSHRRLY